MRISIIGAGAIGSVAAAYLSKTGQEVTLVGRKEQVRVIRENGLRIQGARGVENVQVDIRERLDQEADLIIFTVKTQDLQEAIEQNKEFLKKGLILSSQNGVQADNILAEHFPKERLVSSILMFGSTYVEPGKVTFNFEGDWILGRPFAANDEHVQNIAETLKKAFPVVVSDDILGMKYLKLFVNFNNCIPAVIGKSMQETFADLDLCRLSILLLKEGVEIVQKAGKNLLSLPQFPAERVYGLAKMPIEQAAGIINKTLTGLSKEPLYGSILQSILRGRKSEIDFINGEVVRLADALGIEAPLNKEIVELVHRVEEGGQFISREKIKETFKLSVSAVS